MLFGLRFNLLKDKLFNYINYTSGDTRKLFYEVNYLLNNDILIDYVYKKRLDEDELYENNDDFDFNFSTYKHYLTFHKILSDKKNKLAAGFYLTNSCLGLRFAQKHTFNKTDSFRYNIKL